MTRRIGIGTSAAVASRLLNIPASNIRKWVHLNQVHVHRDGSIDIGCLEVYALRREHTPTERAELHDQMCRASKRMTPDQLRMRRRVTGATRQTSRSLQSPPKNGTIGQVDDPCPPAG